MNTVRSNSASAIYSIPQWCAVYTNSNCEKTVAAHLNARDIDHFLPTYEVNSRWKDRIAKLQRPLFAGYVFAKFVLCERLRVLEIPQVVRLLSFDGIPSVIPDDEIEALREAVRLSYRLEPYSGFEPGEKVTIASGPFSGRDGIVLAVKNHFRVALSVESIARSFVVELPAADVRCAPRPLRPHSSPRMNSIAG